MKAKISSPRKEASQEKTHRVQSIIKVLDKAYPDPTLALDFSSPFELLIALILAAQCTDVFVNQVTAPLFKKYRTPQDWADLNPNTFENEEEIRKVTFYGNKTQSIQKCCLNWSLVLKKQWLRHSMI